MTDRSETHRSPRARVRESDSLTRRELEILSFLAGGQRTRDIAGRLDISENTVKSHLTRAYRKTGSRNRVEAVRYYLANCTGDQAGHHPAAPLGAGEGALSGTEDTTLLNQQIMQIRARIDQLSETVAAATTESSQLEAALAALLAIEAAGPPRPPGAPDR